MPLSDDARLIVVSNRLPVKQTKQDGRTLFSESDGGLVSSLKSFFDRYDGRFTERYWIGAADFEEAKWRRFTASSAPFSG